MSDITASRPEVVNGHTDVICSTSIRHILAVRKIHLLFFRFKLRIMPGSVSGKPVVLHGRTLTLRNNA